MAQARVERPLRRQLPFGLQVFIDVRDVIVLVAAQRAQYAQRVADEVLEALPMLVERVVGQATDQRERRIEQRASHRPAQLRTLVVAGEIDDAARVQRTALRSLGNGLELHRPAVAAIGRQLQAVGLADSALVDQAGLGLVDRLAGVVVQCGRIDAARVGRVLGARKTHRVQRLGQRDAVDDQR